MAAEEKPKTNPNGANQWIADPRQQLFLAYYKDPESPSWSNAYQSAIRAGFAHHYARNIMDTLPEWLRESVGTSPLLAKAERNLEEHLDLPLKTQAMGAFGPIFEKVTEKIQDGTYKNGKPKFKKVVKKVPVLVHNPALIKVREQASEFVAETVGKRKFSRRNDGGGATYNVFVFANEQRARIAKRIVGGGSVSDSDGPGASD